MVAHISLSREGKLAHYKVIHFATHGLLSGESEAILKAKAEPALILTPPKDGTPDAEFAEDDGLLTASEVAQLELDADWVVLSACNTAAGETGDAEALSGLARAFFYAKARALLVSHWPVNSDAAVKLTTKTFSELKSHPEIGRAEALRRSMVELIHHGPAEDAHPAMWGALRARWRGRRGSLISSNAGHSFSTGGTCSLKEASYSPRLAHRRLEEIGRSNAIAPAWRLPTRIQALLLPDRAADGLARTRASA